MGERGWNGDPVDVVRTPDGLTTIDNTRVAVAQELGLPEIPVNIVDLGLIYSAQVTPSEQGGKKIGVKMSMTAPGCGMANVLKADVESKLSRLPDVKEVDVEVVFDPPWHPGRMSEAAKLQLGFDSDYGADSSSFPIVR